MILNTENQKKIAIRLVSFLVLTVLVLKLSAPTISQAAPSFNYIVELHNQGDVKNLEKYGINIKPVYPFSNNEEFRNILSFSSVLPITDLQNFLQGSIDYLELNKEITESGTVYTNDPGFTSDYQNIDKQWGLVKANFLDAWSETTGSTSTTIAVIDTGVDATHEDLQNMHLVDGYNFISNMPLSGRFNSDDNGHGTLITGILAATPNNGVGIAGADWQGSIMPIKVLDSSGKGDSAMVSQAIVWAVDHGAKIINLSFGGIGFDHDITLTNAVSYAFNKNVLIVAAAGNDVAKTGGNLDINPVFPICDDNNLNMILGVAALDQNDLKANFSNYGKGCIDVSAPGKRILSTINYDPVTNKPAPNSYAYASGTSMAAPFVSAEAALIWSLRPSLTNIQVRDLIIHTADAIDSLNISQCQNSTCAGLLGSGRINVKKALDTPVDSLGIPDGSLVKSALDSAVYLIVGGQKRPVSPFVQNQRYLGISPQVVTETQLANFPEGPYAMPVDGTLVKDDQGSTVYYISQGIKLPVIASVFKQRQFSFSNIQIVSFSELNSWVTGTFLPPPDGTVLKASKSKTIFWVVAQSLHPVSSSFYKSRGLNVFPIYTMKDADIAGFSKAEAYTQ